MPVRINSVSPSRTALIVVDMQNDFVSDDGALQSPQAKALVPELANMLSFCREKGIRVIYTAQVHRKDRSDMGPYAEMYERVGDQTALVDGTSGVDIIAELKPEADEHVIVKRRYSAFFGTDLDIILREWGIDTVAVTGATTENCCHATARDAMFRNYRVAFLSDLTGTYDYPDNGQGAVPAEQVHRTTLSILDSSTAHVMDAAEFRARVAAA